jgi:hypothetical protein
VFDLLFSQRPNSASTSDFLARREANDGVKMLNVYLMQV